MRISDWSSDVCSSDLQRAINLQFRAIQVAGECLPFARRAMNEQNARRARAIEFGVLQRVAGDGLRLQFRPWWIREQLFHLASGIRRTEAGTEIGSASCRERVCQYV